MSSLAKRDFADKNFLTLSAAGMAPVLHGSIRIWFILLMVYGLFVLSGCATVPPTNIHQPMTARPAPLPQSQAANGAIYQAGYSNKPLFEDRRARNVGDTLTVLLNENNSASLKAGKKESHTGAASASLSPNIFAGVGGATTNTALINGTTSNNYENKDDNSNTGLLSGSIAVTVIEVLPNGNLLVSGEKQIAVKSNTDYIRLSGVVNPNNVTSSNTVNSNQIADARVEYKPNESIDQAQIMSILSRFFLSVLPL